MSMKKQIHSLSELLLINEEVVSGFMDETDVYGFSYHKFVTFLNMITG